MHSPDSLRGQQYVLPGINPQPRVETELWRIADRMFPPGREILIEGFQKLAHVVANWVKGRSVQRGDAAAWLHAFAESRDLTKSYSVDKVQLAIELAFEILDEDEAADEQRPPEFSDDALADAFTKRHRDELRYVAAWGRWFIWDGTCWREDDTLHAFSRFRRSDKYRSAVVGRARSRRQTREPPTRLLRFQADSAYSLILS